MEHASSVISDFERNDINEITASIFNNFNTFKNDIALYADVTDDLKGFLLKQKNMETILLLF